MHNIFYDSYMYVQTKLLVVLCYADDMLWYFLAWDY